MMTLMLAALTTGCGRDPAPVRVADAGEPGFVDAALPPAGLGTGWQEIAAPADRPPWPWLQADCPGYRDGDYPAQRHRRDAVQRRYQQDRTALNALHVVEEYEPGWAVRALEDTRRVLNSCSEYAAWGGKISFVAVPANVPAEDAILVRGRIERAGAPATITYFVTVRCGDLVSTLSFPDPANERTVHETAAMVADLLG